MVLPAPFDPAMRTSEPGATVNDMPVKSVRSPRSQVSPRTSIRGWVIELGVVMSGVLCVQGLRTLEFYFAGQFRNRKLRPPYRNYSL